MATLGNILERAGGRPMTPRIVTITLALPDPEGGAPLVVDSEVALLPVSIPKQARAVAAAMADVRKSLEPDFAGDPLDAVHEVKLRFLRAALRDPQDLRRNFVEEKHLASFREALIGEQLNVLAWEYDQLLQSEYTEVVEHAKRIKEEAKATFPKGQA